MPARRPFSPISSTASLRTNGDPFDDQNILHNDPTKQHKPVLKNETSHTTVTSATATFTTPSKTIPPPAVDEENRTPKVISIPIPSTPSTISAPMQTLVTPVPAPQHRYGENNSVEEAQEEIEYSFEERRAGFVLPITTPLKRAIQV